MIKRAYKWVIIALLIIRSSMGVIAQQVTIASPDGKIVIGLFNLQNQSQGEWYLKVKYNQQGNTSDIIPHIKLGISRSDQDFSTQLKFLKAGKQIRISEMYNALHGKRSQRSNLANETTITFENPGKQKLNVIVRAYNDGIAFRYEFPESNGTFTILDELTAYIIPDSTDQWLEKFDLSNEGLYTKTRDGSIQQNWCYPALFKSAENTWYLIHEADVNRSYCATKLSNLAGHNNFKVCLPLPEEGDGEALPSVTLPWKSPWRVIIIGSLADIVESTLVDDVSTATTMKNTGWIQPGVASWNYWSDNHGTKDYQVVCAFADLAAVMNWPYTLLDWEWDAMGNGGNLEDALKYIHSKGLKPLMWYNSGAFKWIQATPRDRLFTHESRVKEFAWLKEMGVAGIKVDFFLSEKQDMIRYYLDILEDAAQFELMVYFHGCLVPRGWSRTYPHLMTYEGIRGAEWYNNGPEFTTTAPEHNTIVPFTRNVVGSMDYTPVTFTNSQYPHITSFGHELALSIVLESAIQHMADRPDGYLSLPDAPRSFLKEIPAAWDDTKLLDGYPGKDVIIARRKGNLWYMGGINAESGEKQKNIPLHFLPEGVKYRLTLISDGKHDMDFQTQIRVVDRSDFIDVKLLRRGGFAASLKPVF